MMIQSKELPHRTTKANNFLELNEEFYKNPRSVIFNDYQSFPDIDVTDENWNIRFSLKNIYKSLCNFTHKHSTTVVVTVAQIYLLIILWKLQVDSIYILFAIVLLCGFLTGALSEMITKS